MASTLKNIVAYVAVASGAQETLAHGLNREGTGLVPDSVRFSNELFSLVAADDTNLTVQNNGPAALDLNALVESWHTVDRNFVTPGQAALSPQPFVDNSASVSIGGVQPSVFVFRPGGVTIGNIYATWAELYAELPTVDGPKEIHFDDSIVTPAVVPAGGPYDMTDVTWTGSLASATTTAVSIADGATFTNLLRFANGITVTNNALTAPCEFNNFDSLFLSESANIQSGAGAAEMFDGSSLLVNSSVFCVLEGNSSIGSFAGVTVIDMGAAVLTSLFVTMNEGCSVQTDAISGNAAAVIYPNYLSSSAFMRGLSGWAGAFSNDVRAGGRFNMEPARGAVPSIAPVVSPYPFSHVRLNANAGSFTQVMPQIAGAGVWYTDGWTFAVTETSGTNGVTLDGSGAETINGQATYFLPPGTTMMFISDGVSNWTSVAISNAFAGPSGDFVFRPGGVEDIAQRIFTDWPTLMLALDSVDGPQVLVFDDTVSSPCIIPAGTYEMENVTWRGESEGYGGDRTTVRISDDAFFTNLRRFEKNIRIENRNTTTSPVADLVDGDVITLTDGVDLYEQGGGGIVPFFYFDGGIVGSQVELRLEDSTLGFYNPAIPVFEVDGARELILQLGENSTIWNDVLADGGSATLTVYHNSESARLYAPQANWTGDIDYNEQVNLTDNVLGVDTHASLGFVFFLQLTVVAGNTRQLNVPTGLVPGRTYMWIFRQPVAGGEAVTFPATFYFPGGVDMVLSAGANAVDVMTAVAVDTNPGGVPNVILLDVSQLDFQ